MPSSQSSHTQFEFKMNESRVRQAILFWFGIANLYVIFNLLSKIVMQRPFDNTDFYQSAYAIAFGLLALVFYIRKPPPYFSSATRPVIRFLLLFLPVAILEGLPQSLYKHFVLDKSVGAALASFIIARVGTVTWAAGVYWAFSRFSLSVFEACILGGLVGWFNEAVVFHPLWQSMPLSHFVFLLPPIVAWHYVLLVLFGLTLWPNRGVFRVGEAES